MSATDERLCATCGDAEGEAHLERCVVCGKWFCNDCSYRTSGRRFCSQNCATQYYYGDFDDDEDDVTADD